MKATLRYFSLFAGASALVLAASACAGQRRFTVQDSIGLSEFVHPSLSHFGQFLPIQPVTPSADGSRLAFGTMRGNVDSGKREATLWVIDNSAVLDALKGGGVHAAPKALATFASASNRQPLLYWRWSQDGNSLLVLAGDDDGVARIHRVTLDGKVSALTPADQDVSRFDESNGQLVYLAHKPVRPGDLFQAAGPSLPDINYATGDNVLPLVFPNWMDAEFGNATDEVWRLDDGHPVPVLAEGGKSPLRLRDSTLSLSPDGRSAVVSVFTRRIIKPWERYAPDMGMDALRLKADTPQTEGSEGQYRPLQYALLDLAKGSLKILVDAPIDYMMAREHVVAPLWSVDGARIALPGVYPPLGSGTGDVYACEIGLVEASGEGFNCVGPQHPIDLSKNPYASRPQMMALQWSGDGVRSVYARPKEPNVLLARDFAPGNGPSWGDGPLSPLSQDFRLQVQQSLDQPPVLAAVGSSGSSVVLFDPNPQLKDVALGKTRLYQWHNAAGDEYTGALLLPPDYKAGQRYPLVIQTHGLDREKFLADGPSATGFAARALAAKGMAVLQMGEINKNLDSPKESESGADGYRAAVKQLVKEGVVDADKVGIITWSHMGPYAMQGIVDQPGFYKAASFAEAAYDSYGEYLVNIDYMGGPEREKMMRDQYGPKPFGSGLKTWTDNAVGFHTDRVCTPIFFQSNSAPALIYSWDAYAALRAQDKPVELLYIRNGDHVSVKPPERLVEQGMNVDWFDFWLNGHEDPNPEKAAQYRRWRAMRPLPECPADAIPPG